MFTNFKILLITTGIFLLPIIFFLTYFKVFEKGDIAKKYRNLRLQNSRKLSLIKFIKIIKGEDLSLKHLIKIIIELLIRYNDYIYI